MDLWVGSDDLPVQPRQEVGSTTVTLDFERFGATAEVKAPPVGQTSDVTELFPDGSGRQG